MKIIAAINIDLAIHKALTRIGRKADFDVLAFANSNEFFMWLEERCRSDAGCDHSLSVVLNAKMLVAELGRYAIDPVRRIPKICIGVPDEFGSVIGVVNALEVQFMRWPFTMSELGYCVEQSLQRYIALVGEVLDHQHVMGQFATLTRREHEVCSLIAQGETNLIIAERMQISIKTVKAHRAKVMSKTCSATFADFVRNFERWQSLLSAQKDVHSLTRMPEQV
jgi:FixJ family two-component response regulator